jgi:hypothetical protein
MIIQTLPDLRNSCFPEDTAQVNFAQVGIEHMYSFIL